MVTLLLASVVGTLLAGVLGTISQHHLAIRRSEAWNLCIPVVEGGIEEALAHLHANFPNRLNLDGWILANGFHEKSLGTAEQYVVMQISAATNPVIYAHGFVRIPISKDYVRRTVQVNLRAVGPFLNALSTRGALQLNGQSGTDSFDSTDLRYSSQGKYDRSKRRDRGSIASNGQDAGIVSVNGSVRVYGRASTGPGGTLATNGPISVGSLSWVDQGKTGVEPGYFTDDMNVDFPDVQLPSFAGALAPAPGLVGGVAYSLVMTGGRYQLPALSYSLGQAVLVTGPTLLYVSGDFQLSGQSQIIIAPGGSLTLYVGGANTVIAGQGIQNLSENARQFSYYGLPSNRSIQIVGNVAFIGTIYAPSARLSLTGGGVVDQDFIGAAVVQEAVITGKFQFHYDESLSTTGPLRFVVENWNEI